MKDYISKLSDEELKKYSRIVSGKILKDIFKSHPKDYQTLSYGKRPETLKHEECIGLVVKKRKNRFIQTVMNSNADYIVSETLKYIKNNTTDEVTADEALTHIIIEFGFAEEVGLFLKLTERPTDEKYVNTITALIDEIRKKTKKEQQAESEDSVEELTVPEAISEMENQLAEMQQRVQNALEQYEAEKAARESDHARHKEEMESLQKQLSVSQTRVTQLETEMNRLLVFDDSEVIRKINSDYQHISLCQLTSYNSNNVLYANRLADVNSMGVIHSFI
ncbi:MAG: hypothetical protein IJ192_02925, partial [Clostridia bacterium]|nr:hypothetical protein [Clostridia bacterium]